MNEIHNAKELWAMANDETRVNPQTFYGLYLACDDCCDCPYQTECNISCIEYMRYVKDSTKRPRIE